MQGLSRLVRAEVVAKTKAKVALISIYHLNTACNAIEASQPEYLFGRGRSFCSTSGNANNPPPNQQAPPTQPQTPTPPPPPPPPSYASTDYSSYQQTTVRRRPYNLEAKMRMKQYRREAMHRQQALEIEEEERNFQLDQSKLYQKGDPGTMQGIVKDIITVGYFMSLPDGREGFLPCMQLGCTGGIPLLTRLFKIGDEITVRQQKMYDGGKDKLFTKKDSA